MTRRPTFRRAGQRMQGFTLVELMVAVALGLLLLGALSALVVATVTNNTELDKTARRIENSRYALQVLRDDVELVGFVGQSGNVWTYKAPATICPESPAQYGYVAASGQAPAPVQIISAAEIAAAIPSCLAGEQVKSGTPVLLVTRVSTVAVAPAAAVDKEVYVQVSNCKDDSDRMVVGRGSADPDANTGTFWLHTLKCISREREGVRKAIHRLYFISDCNHCSKEDEVPTLKVLDYVAGERKVTALAEGIEDFELKTRFQGCKGCKNDYVVKPQKPEDWANAVAMTITVTARDTEKSTSAAGRDYRRQTDSMTVQLNNAPSNLEGAPAAPAGGPSSPNST